MSHLKALKKLVTDGVSQVTSLVQRTHHGVAERALERIEALTPLGPAARTVEGIHRSIADNVYGSIQLINGGVDQVSDVLIDAAGADDEKPSEVGPPSLGDHAHSALNGALGDYLQRTDSDLALSMSLRDSQGRVLLAENRASVSERAQGEAAAERTPVSDVGASQDAAGEAKASTLRRLSRKGPAGEEWQGAGRAAVVFVHGLAANEGSWSFCRGEPQPTFGERLAADLGFTPLWLRYNSGRPIAENGALLSELLDQLLVRSPQPPKRLVLVGHSMGGLVVRSATLQGRDSPWQRLLSDVICLGSPHEGAPLAKLATTLGEVLGHVDAAAADVGREILAARSAGIKDLHHGAPLAPEESWPRLQEEKEGGPRQLFIGATVTRDAEHPLGDLAGDLLVRPESATAPTAATRRLVLGGLDHLELLTHPRVYEAIVEHLGDTPNSR